MHGKWAKTHMKITLSRHSEHSKKTTNENQFASICCCCSRCGVSCHLLEDLAVLLLVLNGDRAALYRQATTTNIHSYEQQQQNYNRREEQKCEISPFAHAH